MLGITTSPWLGIESHSRFGASRSRDTSPIDYPINVTWCNVLCKGDNRCHLALLFTQTGHLSVLVWNQAVDWPPPRSRDKPLFWDKSDIKRTCSLFCPYPGYFDIFYPVNWFNYIICAWPLATGDLYVWPGRALAIYCFESTADSGILISVHNCHNQHLSPSL